MANPNKSAIDIPSHIDLFLRANDAKKINRTGWGMHGIKDCESVAEHTFSLSFLTMQLAPLISDAIDYPLNINKLIKMAILHDIGEIETGDIVVSRGGHIDLEMRREKELKEKKGIKRLFKNSDKTNIAVSLFDEMVERSTIEASIFWQLDKLDMAIQALTYELTEKKDLSEFFENAKIHISNDLLRLFFEEIVGRRPSR